MNGRRAWRPAAPIIVIGLVIVAAAIGHVVRGDNELLPELLDAGVLLVFACAVLAVGYRVAVDPIGGQSITRILGFTLGSSLIVGGLSAVFVIARLATGESLPGMEFVLAIGFSLGAATGSLIGYYLDRYERSIQQEAELSRRLTVLQRVLRHNIRNEVTIIEGVSRDLTDRVDDPAVADGLSLIVDHIGRVYRVAEKSQDLAAVWQTSETTVVDVVSSIDDAIRTVSDEHPHATITSRLPDALRIEAHPRIALAFEEALDNAARHNEDVTIDVTATLNDRTATVSVSDTGSGIPQSEVAPLVRGHERPLDHTTGIGLWFIYWLVDHSDGTLAFSKSNTGGTVVEMTLPVAD